MAEIKNIYEDSERTKEIYPITHEKAVIDNNGTTAETKFQMITDLVNQKQMEVGAVPSDLVPTIGSTKWVTSGGLFQKFQNIENTIGTSGGQQELAVSWQSGTLINGVESEDNTRIRTGYIRVSDYDNLIITPSSTSNVAVQSFSSASSSGYVSSTSWMSTEYVVPTTYPYIRIMGRDSSSSTITPSYGSNIDLKYDLPATSGIIGELDNRIKGNGKIESGAVLTLGTSIKEDFLSMTSVNNDGTLQTLSPSSQNLGNCTSALIQVSDLTIVPVNNNVIFKVVYYQSDGTFVSSTAYMAKSANTYVTSDNVVSQYVVNTGYCRIVCALTTLSTGSKDKDTVLENVSFTGASAGISDVYNLFSYKKANQFTASNFRAYVPIKKHDGKWYAEFDPYEKILASSVTAYVSTDGSDSNNGLTPSTAVKTIDAAKNIGTTIILLAGTYTAGTHFTNNLSLSGINLIGEGNVIVDSNGGAPLLINGNAYVESIVFRNGNDGSLKVQLTSTSYTCTLNHCEFNEAVGSSYGGLVEQGGTVYVYRCKANDNIKDGFNYHKTSGNVVPHVAEIECEAYNNGNADSYNSNNATTVHDGCQILRVNGRYGYCHGGVLADVNSGTISRNYGCVVLSSTLVSSSSSDTPFKTSVYCGSGAKIYLTDCAISGSTYALSSVDSNSVIYTDTTYTNTYTASSGSIVVQ